MALTPIKIPDFQQSRSIVDSEGRPFSEFLRAINTAFKVLVNNANATNAALAAAGIATAAAAAANNAAVATTATTALANSYVSGLTVTATVVGGSVTVAMSVHTRFYATAPVTNVPVSAGDITGLAYSTIYYIYYDQPTRAGGAVTYLATVNVADIAQVGSRHSVATVTTPAAAGAPTNGGGVRPPGGNYNEP